MRNREIAPFNFSTPRRGRLRRLLLETSRSCSLYPRLCEGTRKRKLRELYATTQYLAAPHKLLHDIDADAPPDEAETRFLDQNDIAKGLLFNDSTLPTPPPASPQLHVTKPSSKGPKLSIPDFALPTEPPHAAAQPEPSGSVKSLTTAQPEEREPKSPSVDAKRAYPQRHTSSVEPDGNSAESRPVDGPVKRRDTSEITLQPGDIRIGEVREVIVEESEADREGEATEEHGVEQEKDVIATEPIPAKDGNGDVEMRDAQHYRKEEEQVSKKYMAASTTNGVPTTEAISSPSSTVGPYSTTTPHPNVHSPDTSPDEETFPRRPSQQHEMIAPVTPVSQTLKAPLPIAQEPLEHTRATPDAQLRAEEQQARMSLPPKVDETVAKAANDTAGAPSAEVAEEKEADVPSETPSKSEDATKEPESAKEMRSVPSQPAVKDSIATEESAVPTEGNAAAKAVPTESKDVPAPTATAPIEKVPTPSAPQPSRMTTRVSSGAIRHKSVSEILGEAQGIPHAPEKATTSANHIDDQKDSINQISQIPSQPLEHGRKASREFDGNKKTTAVTLHKRRESENIDTRQMISGDYEALRGVFEGEKRLDYFKGLFSIQAHQPPRSSSLQELVTQANKTLTTSNLYATQREIQDYRILKRIYALQQANKWSLRQQQKSAEPPRPANFLDHFLAQAKWMRTDFREERKWKHATARAVAHWCAQWVNGNEELRRAMQVRVKPRGIQLSGPQHQSDNTDTMDRDTTSHQAEQQPVSTPDLMPAGETESESFPSEVGEEIQPSLLTTLSPPASLFRFGADDTVLQLALGQPAAQQLLNEIPEVKPADVLDHVLEQADPAKQPINPVSRFVTGKIVSTAKGPPRKRSRFEYEQEDEDNEESSRRPSIASASASGSVPGSAGPGSATTPRNRMLPPTSPAAHSVSPGRRRPSPYDLPPEDTSCALFLSENRNVRDRLHASHAFRPPSEFGMPSTAFFESRQPSQWLWDEDQLLRQRVKEYSYNWSLISDELSPKSMFSSGAERRTPWECFERWMQLEGLPSEMSRTPYFRTYTARMEAAQRNFLAQQTQQQGGNQQQGAGNQTPTNSNSSAQLGIPQRRRTTQPVRVERRRNNRHLALVDGMRKVARKRESLAHKQQESEYPVY
ncbi:hypothetical protein BDY21DRAFT_96748 [Lineolata rhizophorae]|uniref:Vacuolar import and degradation protein 21 n=1 Tax=Lineolata rhizophorae TaxID=578093 RepID=A0A6A6NUG5_9PEZI|nr:hypothetical protein BDY21DRAFT_96748 [Lineolata rhizophorae]